MRPINPLLERLSRICDLTAEILFWVMVFFLIILTLSYIYEWKKGALDLE